MKRKTEVKKKDVSFFKENDFISLCYFDFCDQFLASLAEKDKQQVRSAALVGILPFFIPVEDTAR